MGNLETLSGFYDRFTGLIEKLPSGLQKPIMAELEPMREVYLDQRPARIALIGGDPAMTVPAWLASLGAGLVETGDSADGWRSYRVPGRGRVEIFDAREGARVAAGADLSVEMRDEPGEAERICEALPPSARLEFARMTDAREAQRKIAMSSMKSFTAVCGVIGVQPIPLADLPVLMAIQTLMVGMIIHVSGRRLSPRLVAEFLGALGVNFGIGLAFRQGARALLKVVPVWGHAISGAMAGAGTYAIGRAAIAYFIDDAPRDEARRIFWKSKQPADPAS
ncbi:MAG: hypothetical protein WA771_11590 [Chthoniobacterales bacterium]